MIRRHREASGIAVESVSIPRRRKRQVTRLVKNAWSFLQSRHPRAAGFTLIEMAFACEVIMLLSLITFNETRSVKEHARVAACLQYHSVVQRSLWGEYAVAGDFPNALGPLLAKLPPCSIGNDFDYKGGLGGGMSGDYYLRCTHNHSYVGVLFVDSGSYLPPKVVYNLASARGTIP